MLIIGKTVVAAAGTPGPLLGDGVNTTCTILVPSSTTGVDLFNPRDPDGTAVAILNRAAADGRAALPVAALTIFAHGANTGAAFYGAAGAASADLQKLAIPGTNTAPVSPRLGLLDVEVLDLHDFDIDAAVNGEAVIWYAEKI